MIFETLYESAKRGEMLLISFKKYLLEENIHGYHKTPVCNPSRPCG